MKTPGQAWLQWEVNPEESGSRLIQKAVFVPFGLWGTLYWYCLYPIHRVIFRSLAKAIARDSETYLNEKEPRCREHDRESLAATSDPGITL